MGVWGVKPFENDSAADWVYDLEKVDDLSVIKKAFERILRRKEKEIESSRAEEAIAAAETIAKLIGKETK